MAHKMAEKQSNFSRRVRAGFLATLFAAVVIGILSFLSLQSIMTRSDSVIFDDAQDLLDVERLRIQAERATASGRGFLIFEDESALENMRIARSKFHELLDHLENQSWSPEGKDYVARIRELETTYAEVVDNMISHRERGSTIKELSSRYELVLQPKRELLEDTLNRYATYKRNKFKAGKSALAIAYNRQLQFLVLISVLAVGIAGAFAWVLGTTLNRLYRQSKNETRLREEIVAIVSHDLKNPLSALGLTHSLLKRFLDSKTNLEKLPQLVRTAQASAERMKVMIESILDVTKIKAGKLSVDQKPVLFHELIKIILQIFEPLSREKEVTLECRNNDPALWVNVDSERVLQVLSNLLGNALKFTPKGGFIQIGALRSDKNLIVSVEDSGPGISEDRLRFVFDPFWQARETAIQGTGLGLSIVKGIVEAHRGKVWVESQLGSGTTFSFTLPLSSGVAVANEQPGLRVGPSETENNKQTSIKSW